MHNHDLVRWGKTSSILDMLAKIYGLQNTKVTCGYICTQHTLGNSWNHLPKQVVPNPQKTLYAWSMTFIYVILTHMVVDNTLNQHIPSIHVNYNMMDYKPHEYIR